MRYIYSTAVLLLLLGCGSSQRTTPNKDILPAAEKSAENIVAPPVVKEEVATAKSEMTVVNFSGSAEVERLMEFLAADELEGRDTGSKGIEKAAQFIVDIFERNQLKPYFSTYLDTLSNFDKPAYNVVAFLEGTDASLKKEFVVIGAHYDHIGLQTPVDGDAIANGANDNASGTATVL